jgi:hypothetical protein
MGFCVATCKCGHYFLVFLDDLDIKKAINYRVTTVRNPGGGEFYMVTRDGGQGPGKMFDSKRDLKNHYPNLRGFDF